MNIKPFGDQILVQPIEKQQTLVADSATLCEYGEVTAVGNKVQEVKVGDKIAFTIWGLNSIEINDKRFYFLREDSDFVLGIVNESLE